jgi:tripartite-type tricarboxylate transporter receptor subunit TctC
MRLLSKPLSFLAFMAAIAPAVCAADGDKAWPERSVKLIVPFAAGGATDLPARLYGDRLSRLWGQAVVIENRPGAEANNGTEEFVRSRDDHTLLFSVTSTLTLNPLIFDKLSFDPARDLVPISMAASIVSVVAVNDTVAAHSLGDLMRLAQEKPGDLLWAGPVLARYTFTASLKKRGLDMRYVPYRDVATPQADLAQGRLHVLASAWQVANAPVQLGKARIIAVTNTDRAPLLPGVPTAAEAGYPELTVDGFVGFFGWRDMPAALRDRIAADVQAVAREPEIRTRLEAAGQGAVGSTPAEFTAAIESQRVRVREIASLIDLKRLSK